MKTMKWLIRREFWEHKGALLWAPLIMGALMVALCGFQLVHNATIESIRHTYNFSGVRLDSMTPSGSFSSEQIDTLAHYMSTAYMMISAPLLVTLAFIVFTHCLNGLYEERRDRSILFWKSLPVSDGMTVLSKVAVAAIVAPLITIAISIVTAIFMLLMSTLALALKGIDVFGIILSSPSFYLGPLEMIGLLPVYVLWAMPTIGWLMMMSSWARSKVILWAVGVPVLTTLLMIWAENIFGVDLNVRWFAAHIAGRILLGVIPGIWIHFGEINTDSFFGSGHFGIDLTSVFTQSWSNLNSPDMWIGVAAGVSMIYVAIRMRRWREEG